MCDIQDLAYLLNYAINPTVGILECLMIKGILTSISSLPSNWSGSKQTHLLWSFPLLKSHQWKPNGAVIHRELMNTKIRTGTLYDPEFLIGTRTGLEGVLLGHGNYSLTTPRQGCDLFDYFKSLYYF